MVEATAVTAVTADAGVEKSKGSSVDSGDATGDGETPPEMSARERIRARLRASEARLSTLVRKTSGDGSESVLSEMKSVRQSLQKSETEKSELEAELNRLRNATDGDDFLKEKMTGIQEGFEKQVKKIQSLEDDLLAKNNEIDNYRQELLRKLHCIVELEFDLETHDVHYTTYAAEQFKLGEEALAEIKTQKQQHAGNDDSNSSLGLDSERSESKRRLTPRRAQKLISKLLSDLDNLEARYKELKLKADAKSETMEMEHEELRTKVQVLEQRLGERSERTSTDDASDAIDMLNVAHLRRRIETLEAKRSLYRSEMDRLKAELKEACKEAVSDSKKANKEIERLRLENDAMKCRIRALETDITEEEDPGIKDFALIEERINENYAEISKLESSNEIKDRQLATLKKEVKNLRVREIARGDIKGTPFTDFDVDLIRDRNVGANKPRDDASSLTAGTHMTDASYVEELQAQLQDAQQQLVKKDQELVIERAKAASTAAGLLARITELTENQNNSSRKGGNAKLRFHL